MLQRVRDDVNEVWNKVVESEKTHPVPEDAKIKVTFYMGQNVEYLGHAAGESSSDEPLPISIGPAPDAES